MIETPVKTDLENTSLSKKSGVKGFRSSVRKSQAYDKDFSYGAVTTQKRNK
jgi:hypothetical protein